MNTQYVKFSGVSHRRSPLAFILYKNKILYYNGNGIYGRDEIVKITRNENLGVSVVCLIE